MVLFHRITGALCIFVGVVLAGEELPYSYDSWTVDDGLPQNTVTDIAQTPDGYLWIGTFGGLARFDGVRFKVFEQSNTPVLHSNRILCLSTDSTGNLWVGTQDGLVQHNGDRFINPIPELHRQEIADIAVTGDSVVWIGTAEGRILRWKNSHITEQANGKIDAIVFFFVDSDNQLWVNNGYKSYRLEKEKFRQYTMKAQALGGILYENNDGRYWFGVSDGITEVLDGRVKTYTAAHGFQGQGALNMIQDQENSFWVGTYQGGLLRFLPHMSGQKFFPLPLRDGRTDYDVRTLFRDREDNLWFGTDVHGLIQVFRKSFTVLSTADGLSGNIIEPVMQDSRGRLWIGTNKSGLNIQTDSGIVQVPALRDESVWALTEDSSGTVWVGTYGSGIYKIRGREVSHLDMEERLSEHVILALYTDFRGTVWIGTKSDGVLRYRLGDWKQYTVADGLAGNQVISIMEDTPDRLIFGTNRGMSILEKGEIQSYSEEDGLTNNQVRSFHKDDSGTVWIGTYGSGLFRWKDSTFFNYTISDGLPDNVVSAILEDESGNLWMTSNRGIFQVHRSVLNSYANGTRTSLNCKLYTKKDGLRSIETTGGFQPSAWKTSDGKLWFPTINGLAVVKPENIPDNKYPPEPVIEEIIIDGRFQELSMGAALQPDVKNLEIKYTALNFTAPEQLTFQYKLKGFDEEWVYAGNRRTAFYTNLPSGEYTFQVRATNNYGVMSGKNAAYNFVINPPFWKSWWAITGGILVFLAIGPTIYFIRVSRLKRSQESQQEFSRRLIEAQEQERKRIGTALHDSIGQELLVIKNTASLSLQRNNPEDSEQHFHSIVDITTNALEEVRKISHNLHPYQLERLGLTRALRSVITASTRQDRIDFSIDIDDIDDCFSKDVETHIYRIVQESIANILKHSNAETAEIIAWKTDDGVLLRIRDDGVGIPFADKEKLVAENHGLGLQGIQERAKILGADFSIDSSPDDGTTLSMTIPMQKDVG